MGANNIAKDSIIYLVKIIIIFGTGFILINIVENIIEDIEILAIAKKVIFGFCFAGFIFLFGKYIDKYKSK